MDLVSFTQIVRRHRWVVVAAILIGAALGAVSSFIGGSEAPVTNTRTYWQATHTVGLTDSEAEFSTPFAIPDRIASTATGPEVAGRVVTQLDGFDLDPTDVQGRLGTVVDPNTGTIDIVAVANDEATATAIADATAAQLSSYIDEAAGSSVAQRRDEYAQRLTSLRNQRAALDADLLNPAIQGTDRDILEAQRDALINEYRLVYDRFTSLADLSTTSIIVTLQPATGTEISADEYQVFVGRARAGTNNLQQVPVGTETAAPADESSIGIDGPVPRGLVGAVLGLFVGIGAALALDRFDTRLHTRADLQACLTAPVLAEVPPISGRERDRWALLARDSPMSRYAEAYRSVRSSLLFQRADRVAEGRSGFVVMVTSAGPKEGKTTTAANLAVVLAEAGQSVLAVNCDFRRPTLRRYFDVVDTPGRIIPSGIPGLSLVTNAVDDPGANPARIVGVQRAAVEQMRERFDIVILDTAPLLTTNDPVDVLPVADVVVVVVRAGHTRREALEQAAELLDHHKASVGGVILNGVSSASNAYYYYYSSDTARAARRAGVGRKGNDTADGATAAGVGWPDANGNAG